MARSEERVAALSDHLWTFNDRSFLPHGDKRDGYPDQQPVWLDVADENLNAATVLFLVDGAESTELASYDLVCRLFDDRDQEAVSAARIRWMEEKEAGYKLTYWQQTNRSWEKKAEYDGDAAGS
jgi:DNA polymerase-3 subunit chi